MDCELCPIIGRIPAGTFLMGERQPGAAAPAWETPPHNVLIAKPFGVGLFEITNSEYVVFLNAMARAGKFYESWVGVYPDQYGSHIRRQNGTDYFVEAGFEKHPATYVSWLGAKAYTHWLSDHTHQVYRLLSEAEWEYAARDGTKGDFYFNDDLASIFKYANIPDYTRLDKYPNWVVVKCIDGYADSSPVGSFAPNAYGLYDMYGNVTEWVEDCWHDSYGGAPTDGSAWVAENVSGSNCAMRVSRGGSFETFSLSGSAARYGALATNRIRSVGFRVARMLTR